MSPIAPDNEIVSSRVFPAQPAAVFGAFADPKLLAQWWGPDGFRNTINQFDLRPGGAWRLVMHAPDGTDYPNESDFAEIDRPHRIVFIHQRPMHRFTTTMTFEPVAADQTRLTWRMVFDDRREVEKLGSFIAVANEQNFDRLAVVLGRARHA